MQGRFSINSQLKRDTTIHGKVANNRTGFLQTPI